MGLVAEDGLVVDGPVRCCPPVTKISQGWYSRTNRPPGRRQAASRGRNVARTAGRKEWNSPNQKVTASTGPDCFGEVVGQGVRSASRKRQSRFSSSAVDLGPSPGARGQIEARGPVAAAGQFMAVQARAAAHIQDVAVRAADRGQLGGQPIHVPGDDSRAAAGHVG